MQNKPKDGFTTMTFVIPNELKRKLKTACAIQGTTIKEVVTKTLESNLDIKDESDKDGMDQR